eukprot:TRINITY_DN3958_c0_g1_i3.p2 TRINITY_DN3958_c0_g1~~TRINITY_DN3958_c0_g1_i3.p2  ORF type:complete len:201 (+),score=-9.16 TRINITY_DN3958_c0_g1_i3:904-1506(+)
MTQHEEKKENQQSKIEPIFQTTYFCKKFNDHEEKKENQQSKIEPIFQTTYFCKKFNDHEEKKENYYYQFFNLHIFATKTSLEKYNYKNAKYAYKVCLAYTLSTIVQVNYSQYTNQLLDIFIPKENTIHRNFTYFHHQKPIYQPQKCKQNLSILMQNTPIYKNANYSYLQCKLNLFQFIQRRKLSIIMKNTRNVCRQNVTK